LPSQQQRAIRQEGLRALYRGVGLTIAGSFPYEGVKFGVYDLLKRRALNAERREPYWKARATICKLWPPGPCARWRARLG